MSSSKTATAASGSRPTIERTFRRVRAAVRKAQHVVEEAVLLVPHFVVVLAHPVHRAGDGQRVLEELLDELLVERLVQRELDRDAQHLLAEEHHPRRAVGLVEVAAGGQRRRAVEHADVVEPEKAALEDVGAGAILAVDPPGEVDQQLGEGVLQELDVAVAAAALLVEQIELHRRPRVHGRIDVAEVPLVGRQLAVRMQVVVAQHQVELLLGEVGIDHAQRNHVERQVPRGVPGVLPLVRHRDDVVVEHVGPLAVAHAPALVLRQVGAGAMFVEPQVEVVVEILLGPQHARQRLAHDVRAVRIACEPRAA